VPGCTTWEFQEFPPKRFVPSSKPNPFISEIFVRINNTLKTYVNLYIVRPTGELKFLYMLSPLEEKEMEYSVGCSFVAIHGIDIVSEFQIRSFSYTEWNLEWKLEPFIISRGMKIPIKIYKLDKDGNEHLIKRMNARKTSHLVSMRNKETPDFVGQKWLAKDLKSNIISSFMALPGCTTWEFQERETKDEDSQEYFSFPDSSDLPPPPPSPPSPSPSPSPSPILLLDANGEDEATKKLYEVRNKFIYTKIKTKWWAALVGPNVTRENLHKQLKNRNLPLGAMVVRTV